MDSVLQVSHRGGLSYIYAVGNRHFIRTDYYQFAMLKTVRKSDFARDAAAFDGRSFDRSSEGGECASAHSRAGDERAAGERGDRVNSSFAEHAGAAGEGDDRTLKAETTRLRLERAKLLLQETDRPVAAVAIRSGFSESKYFCEVFRKSERMTAMAYWRQFTGAPRASRAKSVD
jgi:hypothetical protein